MLKKIFSHTLIYGLAPQISKLVSLVALPFITQHLTEIDFGVFGVVIATVAGASALSTLGLNVVIANTFYKNSYHYKLAWRQLYGFLILWNIVYSFLLGLILYYFIPEEAHENRWIIIFVNILPSLLLGPTAIFGQTYYQYKEQPMQIALRSAVFGLLSVFLSVFLILEYQLGYLGWFIAISTATIGNNISFWIPLNMKLKITPILFFRWRYIKNSLKVSLPVVPHYYSNYLLNSSDQMVMEAINVRTEDIGKYNISYMFGNVIQQIGMAAGKAVGPMLYQCYKEKDEFQARKIIFNLQSLFLSMTFLISIWLKEVFQILVKNENLAQMYPLGVIIIMSYAYRPMYLGANNRFFYLEKTKVLLKISFIAGVANVILNIVLIPYYGFQVAAITTYICLMYMGYIGYFLKDFKANTKLQYHPIIWLSSTLILSVGAYFLVEASLLIKTALSMLIGVGLLYYLKYVSTKSNANNK